MAAFRKILRFASWGVVGLLAAAILVYLIALGINWRDVPPSAAAREFEDIVAQRLPLADEANGFVYLLGFTAPAEQDPQEVGVDRMRWIEALGLGEAPPDADPLQAPLEFIPGDSGLHRLRQACVQDDKIACAREFDALTASWHASELDALALRRYAALLSRDGWREVVPVNISSPLPSFAAALHAQRLAFIELAQRASRADAPEIQRALATDFAWWKRAQRAADNLLSKMIAQSALRQHFFCSTLVMRHLSAEKIAAAVPPEWREEFSAEDRAMKRALAGEIEFNRGLLAQFKAGLSAASDDWLKEYWEEKYPGVALLPLARPLFQVQDQSNHFAGRYLDYARRFEVPMSQYRDVAREIAEERHGVEPPEFPSRIYNITGDLFLTAGDGTLDPNYALRTASIEAMRRLALLHADLHSRAIPPARVEEEIERSTLRDPYDGKPFRWDEERRSLNFEAPEAHHWRNQELFY